MSATGLKNIICTIPDNEDLAGWLRSEDQLREIETMAGWVSPRLGIRFELPNEGLEIYRPDGQKFASYVELEQQKEEAIALAAQAAQRSDRLAAKLQELGIDADTL